MMNIFSCKKEEAPANPYDDVNYDTDTSQQTNPDPNTIVGLHKNIFSTRCALPGCHDGSFEPDFRTVQSTYSTLVYQDVVKTTVDSVHFYSRRVVPGDINSSFLVERLTTTTSDYMPSNGSRLSTDDINHIKTWINNGALDQFGNSAILPNLPPNINWFYAVSTSYVRMDTVKLNGIGYNPFLVSPGQQFYLGMWVDDDSTATNQLTNGKVKFSLDKNDFSNAQTFNASYVGNPFWSWVALVDASAYNPGEQVYFRFYINDGQQVNDTELPRNNSEWWLKSIFSFYIQ